MFSIMLRKRSRATHRDRSKGDQMPDSPREPSFSFDAPPPRNKYTTFFRVPGLFVGFSSKVFPDSDSARSPTSPLDFKGLTNPILGSPKLASNGTKSWDCERVGLGIVDSLNDETNPGGRFLGFAESRSILLGSQRKINVSVPSNGNQIQNSPPEDVIKSLSGSEMVMNSNQSHLRPQILQKSRSCSLGSFRYPPSFARLVYCRSNSDNFCSTQLDSPRFDKRSSNFDSFSGVPSSLPVSLSSEIELSEDYTRVISHGPNPKTTHIFGDRILESHSMSDGNEEGWGIGSPSDRFTDYPIYQLDDFLSCCFSCKKKLEEGKDIYIYRGEKAFCSSSCRMQVILMEEEMEDPESGSLVSNNIN